MGKTPLDEQIAKTLVNNAVNDGFVVSVNDREETVVNRSRNVTEITNAMFRSNTDTLTLNVEERRVGQITLIYGNGSKGLDMIGDYTDSPHINRLVEHTMEKFETSCSPNLQGPDEPPIGHPEETRSGWRSLGKLAKGR